MSNQSKWASWQQLSPAPVEPKVSEKKELVVEPIAVEEPVEELPEVELTSDEIVPKTELKKVVKSKK